MKKKTKETKIPINIYIREISFAAGYLKGKSEIEWPRADEIIGFLENYQINERRKCAK